MKRMMTMQEGDMVRFAKWEEMSASDIRNSKTWSKVPKNHVGILVDHSKLMGEALVLYEGEILKLRAVFVQKAGKKDFEKETDERG
jgi:hypothetical protein